MPNILVLFAHPYPRSKSQVNRIMLRYIRDMQNVILHDLYETYPDLHIDVAREQALLQNADLIVFQHPLYWYSTPAILKEWQDIVLEEGFAYGKQGNALQGKDFMQAISAGSSAESYQTTGTHHFTLPELLRPFEQAANLCGMCYRPPFVIYSAHRLTREAIHDHARAWRDFLQRYLQQGSAVFEPS